MNAPLRFSVLFCLFLLAPTGMLIGQIPDLEQHYPFNTEADFLLDISDNGRHAELDDLGGVAWMMDEERGGVIEFPGSTNGFLSAELPEDGLPGDNFTITFWAYRDLDPAAEPAVRTTACSKFSLTPHFLPPVER